MDPWEKIPAPESADEIPLMRVAEGAHCLEFWRGKNSSNNYVFKFSGKFKIERRRLTQSAYVKVETSSDQYGVNWLSFSLIDPELKKLFQHLTDDMVLAASNGASDDQGAVEVLANRFSHWQKLLSKARNELLSTNAILGLFGELLFLKDKILNADELVVSLQSWRGPLGDEQDFLLGKHLLEVKSQMASGDRQVSISSAAQLDEISGQIYLCHQTFSTDPNNEGASLNSLIEELSGIFEGNYEASNMFEALLNEAGYVRRHEYDEPKHLLIQRRYYDTSGKFPKLSTSTLPLGIDKVQYKIDLTACDEFLVDEITVVQKREDND